MEISGKKVTKDMNISEERKKEIDKLLKESAERVRTGEAKKKSLKEFDEKHNIRMEKIRKLIQNNGKDSTF